ncbi:helix-turn-helix domain-containing protein [Paenibacillaceae bacterium WGS1546]|uniref:response regulator transcription factor n=1 Tax=Cohnella sp. WGS1546 TaxID=3366810 RepID=UPI00372D710E
MNLLLVDDEPFFIEELARIIELFRRETGLPVRVGAAAYSAEEALKLLEGGAFRPDAVFTDIRMSAVDGLELSKTIKQRWPDLPIAIISGYGSFENAREALRTNVTDFLMKPIDIDSVRALLSKLYRDCENRLWERKQALLQSLLHLQKETHLEQWLAQWGEPSASFSLCVLRSPEPAVLAEEWLLAQAGLERNNRSPYWLCTYSGREFVLFVEESDETAADRNPLWLAVGQAIERSPFPISAACRESAVPLPRLRGELFELIRLLDAEIVIGRSKWIRQADGPIPSVRDGALFLNTLTPNLSLLAQRNDWTAFLRETKRLLQEWRKERRPTTIVLYSLRQWLNVLAKELGIKDPVLLSRHEEELTDEVERALSMDELWESLEAHAGRLLDSGQRDPIDGGAASLYQRIVQYLTEHYQEAITTKLLGERFHISRTTLYHLFRVYGNTTFIHCLTQLRMNKAKSLIRDNPSMLLKDIAEQSGYADHNYFSRAFKQITGMTPSEFRDSGLQA